MKKNHSYDDGCYILTTQKILQNQYMNDFSKIGLKQIKSSSNYYCRQFNNQTCAEIRRLFDNKKIKCRNNCVYKNEKNKFLRSNYGITNFSYFLAETEYVGECKSRQLLIIDEAHNLENELSKFIEISISEKFCENFLK